ncbi:MAG: hypothetical protein QGH42_09925 [Kiritimatiellia bacterium]|nr:hypothetical protein [Kiritimatiellia bacterium]MDP6631802.1 hypothetical protein [Kiritimatiellia bacterium]MDP6810441.1 hypothetical protein [Kiritimatiellia bacterium]MDP7024538.1 hypothetical protein [Kiritimatiellia bacterium]
MLKKISLVLAMVAAVALVAVGCITPKNASDKCCGTCKTEVKKSCCGTCKAPAKKACAAGCKKPCCAKKACAADCKKPCCAK